MSSPYVHTARPKCPNHFEPLEVTPKELMAGRGHAPCPVSGALFNWQVDPASKFKDKFGVEHLKVTVTGNEN